MNIDEKINQLDDFKQAVLEWSASYRNEIRRNELRSYINQNKVWVRQQVLEAKCLKILTISPPPAVGGLIMRNIEPLVMLFDAPYGMSMVNYVVDMIDETIGVLRALPEEASDASDAPKVEISVQQNYAFVAMPIDASKPQLEDVLDAIKEGAQRCGVQAERVDEVQSNERITDTILESIRKAEFVIVDLTDSRPNVYYEAGYAQGIGKTPVFVAQKGTELEFDLKDYPVIFFDSLRHLKDELEKRLRDLAKKRGNHALNQRRGTAERQR